MICDGCKNIDFCKYVDEVTKAENELKYEWLGCKFKEKDYSCEWVYPDEWTNITE